MFLVATTTYLDEDEAFETWEVAVLEPPAQNVCVPIVAFINIVQHLARRFYECFTSPAVVDFHELCSRAVQ